LPSSSSNATLSSSSAISFVSALALSRLCCSPSRRSSASSSPGRTIHDDLVRTLGKEAVADSTVTKYARSAQFSGRKEATRSRSSRCGTQSCR
jgi:hypothetical protein